MILPRRIRRVRVGDVARVDGRLRYVHMLTVTRGKRTTHTEDLGAFLADRFMLHGDYIRDVLIAAGWTPPPSEEA